MTKIQVTIIIIKEQKWEDEVKQKTENNEKH